MGADAISFVETPEEIAEFMVSLISISISKAEGKEGKDARILDAGCGKGVFLNCLKKKGFKGVSGVELYEPFYEFCKSKFPEFEIIHADFLRFNPNPERKYDVIIANPPYAHYNSLPAEIRREVASTVGSKESDIYYAFVIKAVKLLAEGGEMVFITPYGFTYNTFARRVRSYLSGGGGGGIEVFVDLDEANLFKGEHPETVIFKFRKGVPPQKMRVLRLKSRKVGKNEIKFYGTKALKERKGNACFEYFEREPFSSSEETWSSFPAFSFGFGRSVKLKKIAEVCVGFVTGFERAFLVEERELEAFTEEERRLVKRFVKAKNCRGYWTEGTVNYVFTADIKSEEELLGLPNVAERLLKYRAELEKRYLPRGRKWFQWQAVRNRRTVEANLGSPKIFVPTLDRSKTSRFCLTYEPVYPCGDTLLVIPRKGLEFFVLGYLNSRLFREFYLSNGGRRGGRVAFTQRLVSEADVPLFSDETTRKISSLARAIYENRDLGCYKEKLEAGVQEAVKGSYTGNQAF